MDETYIKIKGEWKYLYRAVDTSGQTIDFLLTARRDAAAALRFFRKAIRHHGEPGVVIIDKSVPTRVGRQNSCLLDRVLLYLLIYKTNS
jgi:transposase-like protein